MARTSVLACLLALMLAPPLASAQQPPQGYPNRMIRIYQGFPPGGNVDTVARVIGNELGKSFAQPVIVESKPGAGGNLASDFVAKAPADGYSLLLMSASHPTAGAVYATLPFAPVDSFSMISTLITYPFILLVRADSPYMKLGDLLDAARAKPESLAYGSTGTGSIYHLTTELLAKQAGVRLLHIPYKGEAPIMLAVLSGEVPFSLQTPTLALANIKAGKVRALAVTGAKRWRFLPDVPTVSEAGVPGFESESWLALATTAGTPPAAIARLNEEVKRALQSPEVQARLETLGSEPAYSTPQVMQQRVANDVQRWKQVVKERGIDLQ